MSCIIGHCHMALQLSEAKLQAWFLCIFHVSSILQKVDMCRMIIHCGMRLSKAVLEVTSPLQSIFSFLDDHPLLDIP